MISVQDAPVAWAMLMYDVGDAKEDLDTLTAAMQNDPEFDEEYFRVLLSHNLHLVNVAIPTAE